MGSKDMFDNAVKKPVTKAYQCTDDLGQDAVSKAAFDDDAVQVPSEAAVDDDAVQVPSESAVEVDDDAVQVPSVKKSVLSSLYALGCAAVSKIDKSVGKDGVKQKLKKYLPSSESREKIVQALTHPATQEALKLIVPGVAEAANYVGSVLLGENQNDNDEQNKYEHVIQQLKVLQAEIEKMQKQINNLVMTSNNNSSSSTVSEQKPEEQKSEEVITESMTSS